MLNVSDAKTKAVLQQEEEAAQKPFGLKDKIAYKIGRASCRERV